MREYLFRGKMIANGKWSEGNLLVTKQGCCITPDATVLGSYGAVDPETVGQYTGMVDKHGTKILKEISLIFFTARMMTTMESFSTMLVKLNLDLCII